MKTSLATLLLVLAPSVVGAQAAPTLQRQVDDLLATTSIDSIVGQLGGRFVEYVVELSPSLTDDQLAVLKSAVTQAFDPEYTREDVANALVASGSPGFADALLTARLSGAVGELERIAAGYTPPQSLEEFNTGLAARPLPRERMQLMAALVEARGTGDFALNLDEGIRKAAFNLVSATGDSVGTFVGLSEAEFQAAYRDRTLRETVSYLRRYAPASDDLIRRATAEESSEAGRWFVESYLAAILDAIHAEAARVAGLIAPAPASARQPASAAVPPMATATLPNLPVTEVDPHLPCRAVPCTLQVEWSSRPPAYNGTFGNAEDLESRVFEGLIDAGYQVVRGSPGPGIHIRIRPRMTVGICGFMSGTDNRACPAIGEVTVDFFGSVPGVQTPKGLTFRNRCSGEMLMEVNGVGHMVAARVHYQLTTYSGDKRPLPRC